MDKMLWTQKLTNRQVKDLQNLNVTVISAQIQSFMQDLLASKQHKVKYTCNASSTKISYTDKSSQKKRSIIARATLWTLNHFLFLINQRRVDRKLTLSLIYKTDICSCTFIKLHVFYIKAVTISQS